jgi:hypothetical protein
MKLKKLNTLLFFFLLLTQPAVSQTVIKLKQKTGTWKDHHWEQHQFVNPGDSAFLSLGDAIPLDEPHYELKQGIPDGAYSVFLNDTLSLTAFIKHQLRDSVWKYYRNGKLCSIRTFSNGEVIKDVSYDYVCGMRSDSIPPNRSFFYSSSTDGSSIKNLYLLDTGTLVIGLTHYAIEHPVLFKLFLKRNGLTYNKEDYDKVLHPFRLVCSAVRIYKKNNSGFAAVDCKELAIVRSKTKLIRMAGPRIIILANCKPTDHRFIFFNNSLEVYIDSSLQKVFEPLIKQQKAIITHKAIVANKTRYILKYENSVGVYIDWITKEWVDTRLALGAYPHIENLEGKDSHQARF